MKRQHRLGWRPDKGDHRDLHFEPSRAMLRRLPRAVDLRPLCPRVFDQGAIGSCVGCSTNAGFELLAKKQGQPFTGSPLFVYYNARYLEQTTAYDAGAEIRDGVKGLSKFGTCSPDSWPYVPARLAKRPTKKAFVEGELHQALRYERIDSSSITNLKASIAAQCPVAFGFMVYDSFDSIGRSGLMPMPRIRERPIGGHAVLAVGYDDKTQRVTVLNSWGTSWGDRGFFYMPYGFITDTDYADDFWSLQVVE